MTITDPKAQRELAARLEEAGLALSNPRSLRAIRDFKDGVAADECVATALAHETAARAMWREKAFEPWRLRHGLTVQQALSVAFEDGPYDALDPSRDRPTVNSLFAWSGQQHDFAAALRAELKAESAAKPNLAVARASAYPPRAGEAVDLAGPLFDSEGFGHRLVNLTSREVVTVLSGGYHVVFDRATFKCQQHPELTLRNVPLSQEERQAQEEATLQALRGPAAAEDGPVDLLGWLRRLDEWLTIGHFDGFAIDVPGELARLREDLERTGNADPEQVEYLAKCLSFFEAERPRMDGAPLTRRQNAAALGIRAKFEQWGGTPVAAEAEEAVSAPRG